jgi:hypothetical protein
MTATVQEIPAVKDFKDKTAMPIVAVIASGETSTPLIDLQGCNMGALIVPASMTGDAITFVGSADGLYTFPMYNAADQEMSIPFSSSSSGKWVSFNPGDFCAPRFLQLVSNNPEAAARTFQIVPRSY